MQELEMYMKVKQLKLCSIRVLVIENHQKIHWAVSEIHDLGALPCCDEKFFDLTKICESTQYIIILLCRS